MLRKGRGGRRGEKEGRRRGEGGEKVGEQYFETCIKFVKVSKCQIRIVWMELDIKRN